MNKNIFIYVLKFITCFCVLYFGTLAVIGLASPQGNYYSYFIDHHFDYITWAQNSLMFASKKFLFLFGYNVNLVYPNLLRIENGKAVKIGYDCIGYGVASFWIAFVFATKNIFLKKVIWMCAGVFTLWLINVLRISFLLMALNKNFHIPLFDQHTWFNIIAYLLIFIMIYLYDRSFPKISSANNISKFSK